MGYTKHTLTSGTGYSRANNMVMAFLKNVPTPNPNGRKHQLCIYLHGIDHCGPTPDGKLPYGTIDIVANKGVALEIKNGDLPYYRIPGGLVTDTIGTAVLAPQCSTDFASPSTGGTWPFAYAIEMIKYAEGNMSDVVDLNRIFLVGYSLGGGGACSIAKDPYLNPRISSMFAIAPGYVAAPDYQYISDSGLPIYQYHSAADTVTVNGSSVSDGFISQMNLKRPVWPVQYFRFTILTHNTITFLTTQITGQVHPMVNGDNYVHRETIYQTALKHTKNRRTR